MSPRLSAQLGSLFLREADATCGNLLKKLPPAQLIEVRRLEAIGYGLIRQARWGGFFTDPFREEESDATG